MAGSYRKRGKTYLFEYRYKGKYYNKTVKLPDNVTEKQIQNYLNRFCIDIEDNIKPRSNINFSSFAQKWLDEYARVNLSERTVVTYINILNSRILPYFNNRQLNDIESYDIQCFLNSFKNTLKSNTIKKYKDLLSKIFNTSIKWGLIKNNPCYMIEIPKGKQNNFKPIFLDKDEYEKLLECLNNEPTKYQVIIQLALKCGLRRSEISALEWKNIDFKNNTISIEKAMSYIRGSGQILKETKTKTSCRTIHISKSLINLIDKLERKTELVFNYEHIDNITKWFNRFLKKYNLKYMRFHDLRHTHATILISNNVNMKTVSSRLGHANISTTLDIYTHSLNEDDKKASILFD